ncbi:hypothetical protein [Breoghania sp.]|uniref:hypothetical protein n=1 Tax=Breoghania sp. TaxID=2065378 RepID=UPI0026167795|nr:hypothetical protein [Breoghania sp.]MDJ0932177.1 hypothetical protein [Breoghania sp.]
MNHDTCVPKRFGQDDVVETGVLVSRERRMMPACEMQMSAVMRLDLRHGQNADGHHEDEGFHRPLPRSSVEIPRHSLFPDISNFNYRTSGKSLGQYKYIEIRRFLLYLFLEDVFSRYLVTSSRSAAL